MMTLAAPIGESGEMCAKPTNSSEVLTGSRVQRMSWKRRLWWILSLVVLIMLVTIIYVLSHLLAADLEMYPTTMLLAQQAIARLC
jgi:hypothetical protein